MIEKYEAIFNAYKQYIEDNSQYNARVVKYNTNTSTYFPIITFVMVDNTDSNNNTIDRVETFENYYFTIDIYTKNKKSGANTIASQVVNDELTTLSIKFFTQMNMLRTLCQYTPNLDTEILRRTIRYQCQIGNRLNIIRR